MTNSKKSILENEALITQNQSAEILAPAIEQYGTAETIFSGDSRKTLLQRARLQRATGDVSTRFQSIAGREISATSPELKKSLGEEKQKLLREKMRITRFGAIQIKGSLEEQKILENREGFDSIKASDILYLKQTGSDLAPLLLTNTKDPLSVVRGSAIQVGQALTVNYGENKGLNASIGL